MQGAFFLYRYWKRREKRAFALVNGQVMPLDDPEAWNERREELMRRLVHAEEQGAAIEIIQAFTR